MLACSLLPQPAQAHIGSPAAVYEGPAGPYSLRVIVLPAPVIPGRAEINIRLLSPPDPAHAPVRLTVLPVNAQAGLKGAPPPDEAKPVAGEPDLRHAELWLMTPGSYSVHVVAAGPHGEGGTLIVPVVAVANRTLAMSRGLGVPLLFLGSLLFIGAITLVSTGVRDSVRPPETIAPLTPMQRRRGVISAVIATVVIAALVYGGKRWWDTVDREYRNNEVYRASPMTAKVADVGGARVLSLRVAPSGSFFNHGALALIPDHGKLMHLYLIREPQLDAIAHIHPTRAGRRAFAVRLPDLPAGTYRLYADITHETGFAETLTTSITLPAASTPAQTKIEGLPPPQDPDDSYLTPPTPAQSARLRLTTPQPIHANQDTELSFVLESAATPAKPLAAEPYMGMLGHAAIRADDGSVFAHIHPVGTISMAAQDFFMEQAAESTGSPPPAHHHHHAMASPSPAPITFPYLFPKPGPYRIWVQTRFAGQVITTPIDLTVAP